MNNNRENEIKREDKKAFKSFAVIILISAIVGGFIGAGSVYLKETLGDSIENLLISMLEVTTPFANIVLSVLLIIAYNIVYRNSRKEYELWQERNEEDDDYDIVDKIEEKLSYILLFTSISTIFGFFFFGMGLMLSPFDNVGSDFSSVKFVLFLIGFLLNIASTILIQKKIVNFEKEINPLLKGSIYDVKFNEKWVDSCDEAMQLEIYKSAYKAYNTVFTTCIILWVFCVLGYNVWDFGVMPMVMVIIIWLVQTISYCVESVKISKAKSK